MNNYVYRFTWTDKDKVVQNKYVDAPTLDQAKVLFKEWFGFEPKAPKVSVIRLTGADN